MEKSRDFCVENSSLEVKEGELSLLKSRSNKKTCLTLINREIFGLLQNLTKD